MKTKYSETSVFSVFPVPVEEPEGREARLLGHALVHQHPLGLSANLRNRQRQTIRFGWIVLTLTALCCLTALGWVRIEGTVIAQGQIKANLSVQSIQWPDGGQVHQVLVREGQIVQAGELLIELETLKPAAATPDQHRLLRVSEQARQARLMAERNQAASVHFDADLLSRSDQPEVRSLLARERKLFQARRQALDRQILVLEQQLLEAHSEASTLAREFSELSRAEAASKPEPIRTAPRLASLETELAHAHQRIPELQLRLQTLRADYSETAARELRDSSARLLDLEQGLRSGADASGRQPIHAPMAGVVSRLKPLVPGQTISPRETLMEIVPDRAPRVIEARVRPEDIRQVHTGQAADVHLTAYRQRTTPVVEGRVRQISADTFTEPQTQQRYYRIEVEISPEALMSAGALTLQAGMPADLYLRTEARTIARYLVEPFTEVLDRSMREH